MNSVITKTRRRRSTFLPAQLGPKVPVDIQRIRNANVTLAIGATVVLIGAALVLTAVWLLP